jgi:hypothetical protein
MGNACSSEADTVEAKSAALLAVEVSETFARHDQLRAFLHFICESEMKGNGDSLHEYLIGVEVFGQHPGYSTAENAIVRNRAHSLRRKLADFYASEGKDIPLKIEVPKGSYCPRYVSAPPMTVLVPTAPMEPAMPQQTAPVSNSVEGSATLTRQKKAVFSVIAAVVLTAIAGVVAGYRWGHSRALAIDPILAEAWGPLMVPSSHTLVSVANAPELLVRSLPLGSSNYRRLPDELDLRSWYEERYPIGPTDAFYFVPNHNSPLWGDAASAITATRLLTRAGVDFEVLPERVHSAFALRNRNAIIIGRPENSPASAIFLKDMYYNMKYSIAIQDQEVYFVDPQSGKQTDLARIPGRVHGLITVLHERGSDGALSQIVLFSGENSAGSMAAAEFFSSAENMREFKKRLKQDGILRFPDTYQVVISTEEHNFLSFNSSLEAYRAIVR